MDKKLPILNFNYAETVNDLPEYGFFVAHEDLPFEDSPEGMSPANAWWLAELSRIAYLQDIKKAREEILEAGFTDIDFISDDESGTQAIVVYNENHVILAFRGTELGDGFKDAATDFDFILYGGDGEGYLHRGFRKAFEAAREEIEASLMKHIDKKLWITGHSSGGALAAVAGAAWPAQAIYTFGQPRVGTPKWNARIQSPLYRFRKTNDLVTMVPPALFFRHTGEYYHINRSEENLHNPGRITVLKDRIGWNVLRIGWNMIQSIFLKSPWAFFSSFIDDHSLYNYSVNIWNHCEEIMDDD
jgi:hypothetical protein